MMSPSSKDHVKVSNHYSLIIITREVFNLILSILRGAIKNRIFPIQYVSTINNNNFSAMPPITTTTTTEPPTTTTTTTLAPPDPEFGCDFEDGTSCQWTPKEQPWPITSGGEGGPSVDHTTHNGETAIMYTRGIITCISLYLLYFSRNWTFCPVELSWHGTTVESRCEWSPMPLLLVLYGWQPTSQHKRLHR